MVVSQKNKNITIEVNQRTEIIFFCKTSIHYNILIILNSNQIKQNVSHEVIRYEQKETGSKSRVFGSRSLENTGIKFPRYKLTRYKFLRTHVL